MENFYQALAHNSAEIVELRTIRMLEELLLQETTPEVREKIERILKEIHNWNIDTCITPEDWIVNVQDLIIN